MASLKKEKLLHTDDTFDLRRLANYTPSESLGEGDKVLQSEVDPRLRDQIWEYLHNQGYEITEGATLVGKSGISHTFDMLAQKDDGFISYTMAICIAVGGDRETEVNTIFNFANKAYDTGIRDRIIIAIPGISREAKQLLSCLKPKRLACLSWLISNG